MTTEVNSDVLRRAGLHAALADPARLQIVDALALGDAAPSELAELVGVGSNLLAHHLRVLEREGLVARTRSEGDRRRWYVHLVPEALEVLRVRSVRAVPRVLFVCTANSARSHLATAVWRQVSDVPTVSAGTHPATRIAPGAVDAARRHELELPEISPRHLNEVLASGDLVVTVCDRAHEELDHPVDAHWSVPDPITAGTPAAFDDALAELQRRARALAPHLIPQPA